MDLKNPATECHTVLNVYVLNSKSPLVSGIMANSRETFASQWNSLICPASIEHHLNICDDHPRIQTALGPRPKGMGIRRRDPLEQVKVTEGGQSYWPAGMGGCEVRKNCRSRAIFVFSLHV